MQRCRWISSTLKLLNFLKRFLIKSVLLSVFFASSVAAETLAVIYPEVPAPYKQVFDLIIEGIEIQHSGKLIKYPITSPIKPETLLQEMLNDHIDMVVTLGRRGFSYNKALKEHYPLVTGALPIKPNGISGVSLIADPNSLFQHLKTLSPNTLRVHVVFTNKSQWIIDQASNAAKLNKLQLITHKAADIREAVNHYQEIFKTAESEADSIWLPLDSVTANEKVILPLLLRESWDNNLVAFSSKPGHVKRGLLFTLFPDSRQDGIRLAEMVTKMFHSGKPAGVELSDSGRVGVNLRTASHLGLEYSPQLKKSFYQTFPQSGF